MENAGMGVRAMFPAAVGGCPTLGAMPDCNPRTKPCETAQSPLTAHWPRIRRTLADPAQGPQVLRKRPAAGLCSQSSASGYGAFPVLTAWTVLGDTEAHLPTAAFPFIYCCKLCHVINKTVESDFTLFHYSKCAWNHGATPSDNAHSQH